ncbi:MAG: hypothetical protein Q8S84_01290, partial [bacterium]|nr:hypothetical protein [bacterium]
VPVFVVSHVHVVVPLQLSVVQEPVSVVPLQLSVVQDHVSVVPLPVSVPLQVFPLHVTSVIISCSW